MYQKFCATHEVIKSSYICLRTDACMHAYTNVGKKWTIYFCHHHQHHLKSLSLSLDFVCVQFYMCKCPNALEPDTNTHTHTHAICHYHHPLSLHMLQLCDDYCISVSNYIINFELIEYVIKEHWISFVEQYHLLHTVLFAAIFCWWHLLWNNNSSFEIIKWMKYTQREIVSWIIHIYVCVCDFWWTLKPFA